jgi:hypothetical protein
LGLHVKVLNPLMAAVLMALLSAGAVRAEGSSQCAAQCYAAEKSCMRATKGGSACDSALTRCLQGCRTKR